MQGSQGALGAVGQSGTGAEPAVGSGVLDAMKRAGVHEVADAVAGLVPVESVSAAVRVAAGAGELAVEGHGAGVEQNFAAAGGIGLRSTKRDVPDHLEPGGIDDGEGIAGVIAGHENFAVGGKGQAARVS